MRKWMFGCAAGVLAGIAVESAQAQEPIQAPGTIVTASQPATTTVRRGLFGRRSVVQDVTTASQPIGQATGQVIQASAVTPAELPANLQQPQQTESTTLQQTPETEGRQGLFARMRARRGR